MKPQTCETCGIVKGLHPIVMGCQKFKPSNHSPQGHKVGSATGNPAEFKDTPEEKIEKTDSLFRSSGHSSDVKGCGKRFDMKYKGLTINVACGDDGFDLILPLCPSCKKKEVSK